MWHVAREDEQKKQQFYICRNPSLESLKQPQGCALAEGAKPLPLASLPDFSVLYSPQRGPFSQRLLRSDVQAQFLLEN